MPTPAAPTAVAANPIRSEVNFDAPGRHIGFLRLPHSSDRSAYGWLPVPVASLRNGEGTAVLVMAGNHGDEFEGQVIVSRLIRELRAEHIRGHVILLPMANYPAAREGRRTSPLDGGNLNRSFPGDPRGSPTPVLADYIANTLLPRVSVAIDLHSGGHSLLYEGSNLFAQTPATAQARERLLGLTRAFGLGRTFINDGPNPGGLLAAARERGVLALLAELGGGGRVDARSLDDAWHGVRHALAHLGVLHGPLVPDTPPQPTHLLRVDRARHYVHAPEDGVFEPLARLGERVAAGQPAALLHAPESPGREPVAVAFASAGLVVCERALALTRRGDCLFQLAEDLAPA